MDASSASAAAVILQTVNNTDSVCISYSTWKKPTSCEFYYDDADGPAIYSDTVSIIVGIFNREDKEIEYDIALEIVGYGETLDFTPIFIWIGIIGGSLLFLTVCLLPACIFSIAFGLSLRTSSNFTPLNNVSSELDDIEEDNSFAVSPMPKF